MRRLSKVAFFVDFLKISIQDIATMKLQEAIKEAKEVCKKYGYTMAVVDEGLHADDYAELPSYGYCPLVSVKELYKYGKVIQVINV